LEHYLVSTVISYNLLGEFVLIINYIYQINQTLYYQYSYLQIINRFLIKSFRHEWGRVPAHAPDTVIEKVPDARELAQLRDLGKELSARGGVPLDYIKQAFGEAAGAKKFHVSYVRAILLDWLGLPRSPPE